ncbi:MAG: V-type ATP synthase subunit E family protein [Aerococcus sp.]|nr:V-type ATP synthase subunit E family protein [Aerococcus sp.]
MATIEAIKEKILGDIRQEQEAKFAEDKQRVANETTKKQQAIAEDLESKKRHIERKYQQRIQTQVQQFTAQQRHKELQQQDRLMQEVFKSAVQELNHLPAEELFTFVEQALEQVGSKVATELKFGEQTDHILTEEQLQTLKDKYPNVSVSTERVPRVGGFILSQEAVDYNYTYQALLQEKADQLSAHFLAMANKASGEGE